MEFSGTHHGESMTDEQIKDLIVEELKTGGRPRPQVLIAGIKERISLTAGDSAFVVVHGGIQIVINRETKDLGREGILNTIRAQLDSATI